MNTIYTFNSEAKVLLIKDKLSKYNEDINNSSDSKSQSSKGHNSSGSSSSSISKDLGPNKNFRVSFAGLDNDCYSLHFVLY